MLKILFPKNKKELEEEYEFNSRKFGTLTTSTYSLINPSGTKQFWKISAILKLFCGSRTNMFFNISVVTFINHYNKIFLDLYLVSVLH